MNEGAPYLRLESSYRTQTSF